jgi:hypothetical protein
MASAPRPSPGLLYRGEGERGHHRASEGGEGGESVGSPAVGRASAASGWLLGLAAAECSLQTTHRDSCEREIALRLSATRGEARQRRSLASSLTHSHAGLRVPSRQSRQEAKSQTLLAPRPAALVLRRTRSPPPSHLATSLSPDYCTTPQLDREAGTV